MAENFLQFTGGLQTTTSSFLRRPDQLLLSVNVNGEKLGSIQDRLGFSQYGGTVEAAKAVNGMHSYLDTSGGTHNLLTYTNGNLKYNNSGTYTNIQTGLTAAAKPEFRTFLDQVFMVGSDGSGTFLTTANIDGTTYSTATSVTDAPKGKYVETYLDRIYIAYAEIGATEYPTRFYYSSTPTAGAITWTAATDVEDIPGEPFTGMHNNKGLGLLLLFKEDSIYAWDTFRIREVSKVGTTAHRSIKTVNNKTFYFNENVGICFWAGGKEMLISRPIDKWITGIQNPDDVFAEEFDNKDYKLFVGDIVVDGKTYTNCEIRYSDIDNTFTIYSYAYAFTCYTKHKVSGVNRVYAGMIAEVHTLAAKDDEVYDDDGTAISSEFMIEMDLGIPSERKFIDKVLIYAERPQLLKGRMRVRGGDWKTDFSVDDQETEVNINPLEGRFMQLHFSSNSKVAPFIFEGISITPKLTTNKYAS